MKYAKRVDSHNIVRTVIFCVCVNVGVCFEDWQ
jgi:hypothetical protein